MGIEAARKVIKKNNPYEWIQKERYGEWQIMSGRSIHSGGIWTAWAKKGYLVERQPLAEPGEVFIGFGEDRQDAIDRLIKNDLTH